MCQSWLRVVAGLREPTLPTAGVSYFSHAASRSVVLAWDGRVTVCPVGGGRVAGLGRLQGEAEAAWRARAARWLADELDVRAKRASLGA